MFIQILNNSPNLRIEVINIIIVSNLGIAKFIEEIYNHFFTYFYSSIYITIKN